MNHGSLRSRCDETSPPTLEQRLPIWYRGSFAFELLATRPGGAIKSLAERNVPAPQPMPNVGTHWA